MRRVKAHWFGFNTSLCCCYIVNLELAPWTFSINTHTSHAIKLYFIIYSWTVEMWPRNCMLLLLLLLLLSHITLLFVFHSNVSIALHLFAHSVVWWPRTYRQVLCNRSIDRSRASKWAIVYNNFDNTYQLSCRHDDKRDVEKSIRCFLFLLNKQFNLKLERIM